MEKGYKIGVNLGQSEFRMGMEQMASGKLRPVFECHSLSWKNGAQNDLIELVYNI